MFSSLLSSSSSSSSSAWFLVGFTFSSFAVGDHRHYFLQSLFSSSSILVSNRLPRFPLFSSSISSSPFLHVAPHALGCNLSLDFIIIVTYHTEREEWRKIMSLRKREEGNREGGWFEGCNDQEDEQDEKERMKRWKMWSLEEEEGFWDQSELRWKRKSLDGKGCQK